MNYPLKTIEYNNGYASFRIPENWVEEEEKEGQFVFYDEVSDDVFSLRFSLITLAPPGEMNDPTTEDFMKASGMPDYAEKVMIDSNNLIAIHTSREEMEGEGTFLIQYWEYIHKKPDGQFDLALFTWDMDETLASNSIYDDLIQLIDREVKNMKFKDG